MYKNSENQENLNQINAFEYQGLQGTQSPQRPSNNFESKYQEQPNQLIDVFQMQQQQANLQKSQDDAKIIDAIQGLLNLNIFEAGELSESEDGKKNGGTGSCGEKSEDGSLENDVDQDQEKKLFILDCSQRITERIAQVQDLETLQERIYQYVNEYSLEFERKFGKQNKLRDMEASQAQLRKDNQTLKRAVRIMYQKLQNKNRPLGQAENPGALTQQNLQLQKLLSEKDKQILEMQVKMADMTQLMSQMAAKLQDKESQQSGSKSFGFYRQGDAF